MTYQTADITLAAFLLAKGCKLVEVNDDNPRHVRFQFEKAGDLDGLVGSYTTGWAQVNAVLFAQKLSEVKSILWRVKDQRRAEERNEQGSQSC